MTGVQTCALPILASNSSCVMISLSSSSLYIFSSSAISRLDFRQTPDSATDSQPTPQKESADSPAPKSSLDIAEELKIYKELLDSEIITQEEFDAKKKQLLNL